MLIKICRAEINQKHFDLPDLVKKTCHKKQVFLCRSAGQALLQINQKNLTLLLFTVFLQPPTMNR